MTRGRRLGLAAALLALAAAGPAAAQTCADRPAAKPGDANASITVGGVTRTYRVHVPRAYSPTKPTPVVLAFHGGLGTGRYMQRQTRLDPVADAHGFLAVYPDGLYRTWNAGACCEKAMEKNVDDVGFVAGIIASLEREYCVDPRRIFATGFSNGAMLAHRIACEMSDKIAAIAPVSGVIMVATCVPRRPVPVMVFHGSADPRSLWEGGLGDKDPRKGVRASIPDTMAALRARNGCQDSSTTILAKGAATCTAYERCQGGDVALCRLEGAGHQWPGGESVFEGRLGPVNRDISAAEVMWEFFARHPLPADSKR